MTSIGWFGAVLLVAGVIAIGVECAIAALWMRRVSKRAQLLSERIESDREAIEADLVRLRHALAETKVLWQPYGRALRVIRHPLVAALTRSVMRRRSAAVSS